MLSCLLDGAYIRTLAANLKDYPMRRQRVSPLSHYLSCPLPYVRRHITVNVLSVSLNKTFSSFLLNATMVAYGILFGGIQPIGIDMCMLRASSIGIA